MSLIYAASQVGIMGRALEILDELTAKPTQQIRSGAGRIRTACRRRGR